MTMFSCYEETNINELVGKTMIAVTGVTQGEEMVFVCENGTKFIFYHSQDCCESVEIDDIVGELGDLVGSPITVAEEVSESNEDDDEPDDGTFTWTFYKFATIKGSVTVKWYGTSNGYYSESVDLRIECP
jgi:hypothetical protein